MKFILTNIVMLFILLNSHSFADDKIEIGIDEQLGGYLPKDVLFKDENGNDVKLGDLINNVTVLAFVYYECPAICNPLLFELADVINKTDLEPGYDFNVISISIDDLETPEIASAKKKTFYSALDGDIAEESWRFLTGDSLNIKQAADAAGFYFKREGKEFRHAGALIFVDQSGKICRYLFPGYNDKYGYSILPFDFKMAVIETSEGKVNPTIARVLQFCFSYDPEGKSYAFNFTRVFGAGILILAGIFLIIIKIKPKKEFIKPR
jgi:protein SCO1